VPHFKAGKELRELVGLSQDPVTTERSEQSVSLSGVGGDANGSASARYFEMQSTMDSMFESVGGTKSES